MAIVNGRCSRRRVVGLGGTGVALGLLAACAGPGAGGDKIARGKSSRQVTLRCSTWGDEKNSFNTDAAPKGVQLFNQTFPNITISLEPQAGDWQVKNQTQWVAGSGPDLTGHCCYWGAQW